MSLINDALKKAARQRSEEQSEAAPSGLKGGRKRIARRGAPMSVQTLVILAACAVTLIVASVVITGILITGRLEPKSAAVAKALPPSPTPEAIPAVVVNVPRIEQAPLPRPTAPPPTAAPVIAASPSPLPAATVPVAEAEAVRPAVAAPPPAPMSRGDQIQTFVDKLRVTGVRAAGSDSKALVDGHVYRVDDILDRALGIRLVKVDADHLTLVDSSGVTYIKNF